MRVGFFTMSSYTYEASTVFDQIESADPCTTCAGSGHGGDGGGPVLAVGCGRGDRAEASVTVRVRVRVRVRVWVRVHRHEPRDDDIVVEAAEGRQSEVLAGRGRGGRRLLVVEQAGSSGVAAAPPLVHLAPAQWARISHTLLELARTARGVSGRTSGPVLADQGNLLRRHRRIKRK